MMLAAALLLQVAAPSNAVGRTAQKGTSGAVPLKADKVYTGMWMDAFERQQFFEGRALRGSKRSAKPEIWLEIDRWKALKAPKLHPHFADITTPRFYRVRFVGAEARDMACDRKAVGLPACYGHQGFFSGLIVVRRLLSIEELPAFNSGSPR